MSQYYIPFNSINNSTYQVRIYEDGTSFNLSSAIQLQGGETPFMTQEENTPAQNKWVRYSTGYIRFIDDGSGILDTLMSGIPGKWRVTLVVLRRNAVTPTYDIVWDGYIKDEFYSISWTARPLQVDIPVISNLGKIYNSNMSNDNEGIGGVTDLINRLTDNGFKYLYLYMPYNDFAKTGGSFDALDDGPSGSVPVDMNIGWEWDAFKKKRSAKDRNSHTVQTGKGLYENTRFGDVLDSICAVFGWYIREDAFVSGFATNWCLIFQDVDPSCTQYRRYVLPVSSVSSYSIIQFNSTQSVSSLPFASDRHSESLEAPDHIVSLTGNEDPTDETLFSMDDAEAGGYYPIFVKDGWHLAEGNVGLQACKNSDIITCHQYIDNGTGVDEVTDRPFSTPFPYVNQWNSAEGAVQFNRFFGCQPVGIKGWNYVKDDENPLDRGFFFAQPNGSKAAYYHLPALTIRVPFYTVVPCSYQYGSRVYLMVTVANSYHSPWPDILCFGKDDRTKEQKNPESSEYIPMRSDQGGYAFLYTLRIGNKYWDSDKQAWISGTQLGNAYRRLSTEMIIPGTPSKYVIKTCIKPEDFVSSEVDIVNRESDVRGDDLELNIYYESNSPGGATKDFMEVFMKELKIELKQDFAENVQHVFSSEDTFNLSYSKIISNIGDKELEIKTSLGVNGTPCSLFYRTGITYRHIDQLTRRETTATLFNFPVVKVGRFSSSDGVRGMALRTFNLLGRSTPKRKLEMDIRNALSYHALNRFSYNNKEYAVVSNERDYLKNTTRLTIIEK